MKYNFTISDFTGINWKNANIELAYDALEYLPNNEKYEFLKWLAQNYPELPLDWVDEFNEIRSTFKISDNFTACEDFVLWFPERFPEIYAEKFELIERDLCNYYLKINRKDKLQQRIKFIEKYPVNGIETVTIRLFYQLLYHGMYEEALNFARKVFFPIYNNDELYGNPEKIFIQSLYADSLQSTYQVYKKTGNKDFSAIDKLAQEFELNQEPEIFEIEKEALFNPINTEEIMDLLAHSKNLIKGMVKTHIYFMKYMLDEYSVPFCLSNIFWEFIANKQILGNSKDPSEFFFIHAKTFDEYLDKNLDLLLETNLLEIFGKVWALPYIYEFLEKHGLISTKSAAKMSEYNLYHRISMLRLLNNDLWQMSFVFSWPQNHLWADLKPIFEKTFNLNFKEADEIIENYINTDTIYLKVHKEVKGTKSKKLKNWHSNAPYQKDSPKIGRNDPCPCGSGKKYKNCCMKN